MEQKPVFENETGRTSEILDRLEINVGKIGMNSAEISRAILEDLDVVYQRIQEMTIESSQKQASAQMAGITGKLRSEAVVFLRDFGGTIAYQAAREEVQPDSARWWWFLDQYLAEKRQAARKRSLITLGVIALVLLAVGIIYNAFLAPDPKDTERYTRENSAQDALMRGNPDIALQEIEQGLAVVPNDPSLLILRGVIKESQNQMSAAQKDYSIAENALGNRETFLLTRGQDYQMASLNEKALSDAQEVIKLNANSVQGYLLAGQAHEAMKNYQQALDLYNQAYDVADKTGQAQMAAIVRMRTAMLIQVMSAQVDTPEMDLTPTP